jgi:hypothetical protein
MMRIHKTQGKGDWIVVELSTRDIFRVAKDLYEELQRGNSPEFYFYNVTDGQQFRIEVRNEQRNQLQK